MRFSCGTGLIAMIKALVLFVLCGFLFFFACSASRTDDSCRETSKEKIAMKDDRGNDVKNATASSEELVTLPGFEAVAFGMG